MSDEIINAPFVRTKSILELDHVNSLEPGVFLFQKEGEASLKTMDASLFYQMLNNFARPIAPGDAGPFIANQWYKPTTSSADPGTNYPNAGNLKAREGYDSLFWYNGTTWTKIETKLPANSAEPVFNPVDNVKPSTMKATADRYDWVLEASEFLFETKGDIIADFNSCTWVDGSYYNADGTTGSVVATFSRITNYITVEAGKTYFFANSGIAIIWYDNSNVVVGYSGNSNESTVEKRPFIAPTGATKARINILTVNKINFQFIQKIEPVEYVIKKGSIKLDDINGVNVFSIEISNYASCTWVAGQYLQANGNPSALATFNYSSNYISIEGGKYYTFKTSGIAIIWYDINKTFISYGGSTSDQSSQRTFLAPSNAKFCRVNQHNDNLQSFSLKLTISTGGSDFYQIPQLQVNSGQIIGNEQPKLSKIGDVKMFNFTTNTLTGNAIISGDSTIAAYAGGTAIADILKFSGTVTNIAVPGETIAQQLGHWNALTSGVRSSANFVFVQIGLNDLGTGTPSATVTIQALESYFAKIRIDSPTAIIVAGEMLPCKQRMIDLWGSINGDVAYQKWKAMNASLPTIAGVNKVATVHGWLLNDGNDNLKAEFNTGDNIHETTNGRKMIAYSWLISTL